MTSYGPSLSPEESGIAPRLYTDRPSTVVVQEAIAIALLTTVTVLVRRRLSHRDERAGA
jgi:hypothetical protein